MIKCLNCRSEMQKIEVSIDEVTQKVISFQCSRCDYVEFEQESVNRAILELE